MHGLDSRRRVVPAWRRFRAQGRRSGVGRAAWPLAMSSADSRQIANSLPDYVGARARESSAGGDEATGVPPPWHQNCDASDCWAGVGP